MNKKFAKMLQERSSSKEIVGQESPPGDLEIIVLSGVNAADKKKIERARWFDHFGTKKDARDWGHDPADVMVFHNDEGDALRDIQKMGYL